MGNAFCFRPPPAAPDCQCAAVERRFAELVERAELRAIQRAVHLLDVANETFADLALHLLGMTPCERAQLHRRRVLYCDGNVVMLALRSAMDANSAATVRVRALWAAAWPGDERRAAVEPPGSRHIDRRQLQRVLDALAPSELRSYWEFRISWVGLDC